MVVPGLKPELVANLGLRFPELRSDPIGVPRRF
jgi:hypothetical protein